MIYLLTILNLISIISALALDASQGSIKYPWNRKKISHSQSTLPHSPSKIHRLNSKKYIKSTRMSMDMSQDRKRLASFLAAKLNYEEGSVQDRINISFDQFVKFLSEEDVQENLNGFEDQVSRSITNVLASSAYPSNESMMLETQEKVKKLLRYLPMGDLTWVYRALKEYEHFLQTESVENYVQQRSAQLLLNFFSTLQEKISEDEFAEIVHLMYEYPYADLEKQLETGPQAIERCIEIMSHYFDDDEMAHSLGYLMSYFELMKEILDGGNPIAVKVKGMMQKLFHKLMIHVPSSQVKETEELFKGFISPNEISN